MLDRIALILVIIGAIAWGCIGIFAWNPVTWVFGRQVVTLSRIVYTLVGLGGLWCIKLLFREREVVRSGHRD